MNKEIIKLNNEIIRRVNMENILKLSDRKLWQEFKVMSSYRNKENMFKTIFKKEGITEEKIKNIFNNQNFINSLISPGLKGVIRGNKFNKIVKNHIKSQFKLDYEKYKNLNLHFEKKLPSPHNLNSLEIPDWYIIKDKKILIGYNQMDLCGGGHQSNRGKKYVLNDSFENENRKILSVICNYTQIKSVNSLKFKIFRKGFYKKKLCYTTNLLNIIDEYFNLK